MTEITSGMTYSVNSTSAATTGTKYTHVRVGSDEAESTLYSHVLDKWVTSHTGGNGAVLIAIACDKSGSVAPLKRRIGSTEVTGIVPRSPQEALALVQSAFGLSITALAAVLRVERPTIYSWLRNAATPSPANAQRLEAVAGLADFWLEVGGGAPARNLRVPVVDGKSLLELLADEHLRTFAAETAMRTLSQQSHVTISSRPSLGEIARSRGIQRDSTEFDVLTGRRFSQED